MEHGNRRRSGLGLALAALLAAGEAHAQATTDFCGCEGSESLGSFNSHDPSTYPPGVVGTHAAPLQNFIGDCEDAIRIPLDTDGDGDGVLVFDEFVVEGGSPRGCNLNVDFIRNVANTPVTILVKGDVSIASGGRISVRGFTGGSGTTGAPGSPGAPGPGGFAGGEGAYALVNLVTDGGVGVGPGGGLGAILNPASFAAGGTFVGVPELRPLLGGSGGGGGRSVGTLGNSGGGGGGGGGALLLVANGTITINGLIWADGGAGGVQAGSFATAGSGGSGGAIRILAGTIAGGGSVFARGGAAGNSGSVAGNAGLPGRIRMEAIFNTFSASGSNPVALRAPAPGPLENPIKPTVRITGIDGAVAPDEPIGFLNSVDMIVDAPGVIQVDLATTDVPAGTDVAVTVKPKVGGQPVTQNVTLASCTSGACNAATAFDLAAGAYIVEARATFQTP
jgi:hypothetical protein